MQLSHEQLAAIVARALPGDTLKQAAALAEHRYALTMAGGDQFELHSYPSSAEAATAVAALRLLRGEFDLPIPQLRAADVEGETVGRSYTLVSGVGGEPLADLATRLTEDQRYNLGRRLGETVFRIHRLALGRYGALAGDDVETADDERSYALGLLNRDLSSCRQLGLLNDATGQQIQEWFERAFVPPGRGAALIHGGLTPETVLVRQVQGQWTISGLLGWEYASGWAPAWEHTLLLDAFSEQQFFGLRVGYGNAYDDNTQRTYEQVREGVLVPYRLLLLVWQLWQAGAVGDAATSEYLTNSLLSTMRWLTQERDTSAPALPFE